MGIFLGIKKVMPKINHNPNQADRHKNIITGCLSGPLKCPDPEPTPALQVLDYYYAAADDDYNENDCYNIMVL